MADAMVNLVMQSFNSAVQSHMMIVDDEMMHGSPPIKVYLCSTNGIINWMMFGGTC